MPKQELIDITGNVYGSLTAIRHIKYKGWLCHCKCGAEKIVTGGNLRQGSNQSCGCERNARIAQSKITHAEGKTPLYRVWSHMKTRCSNKNVHNYHRYGGRGIAVCSEWNDDFAAFRDWALANGYREDLRIDRRDNDQGYSPENCHFVTVRQNNNNRSANVVINAFGQTMTLQQWSETCFCSVTAGAIRLRLKNGWTPERAITEWARPGVRNLQRVREACNGQQ